MTDQRPKHAGRHFGEEGTQLARIQYFTDSDHLCMRNRAEPTENHGGVGALFLQPNLFPKFATKQHGPEDSVVLSRHFVVGIGGGQRSRGARDVFNFSGWGRSLMSNLGTATIPLGRKEHGGSRKSHRGPVPGGHCDWKGHTRGIWSALGRIRQALRHEADRYSYKQRAGGRFSLSVERRSEVFSRHRSAREGSNPKHPGDDIRGAAGRWEFGAGLRPIYR